MKSSWLTPQVALHQALSYKGGQKVTFALRRTEGVYSFPITDASHLFGGTKIAPHLALIPAHSEAQQFGIPALFVFL